MDNKRADELIYIAELVRKSWLGTLSEREQAALERWKNESEQNRLLFEKINSSKELLAEDLLKWDQYDTSAITQRFLSRTGMSYNETKLPVPIIPFSRNTLMRWVAIAAIFVLIAGFGWYFLSGIKNSNSPQSISRQEKVKVVPGGNKALLTLADGSQVILDSSLNGVISRQGNVQVVKTQDGKLSYRVASAGKATQLSYNTITTPRGGQYQVTLPDGTAIWLNSVSSITFPTAFNEKERVVQITGEAYFEVSQLISKNTPEKVPFVVQAADSRITVLGTHFNINAYTDEEAIRTTLTEGAVSVSSGTASVLISPGEQATLVKDKGYYKITHPDIEEVLAWKNGMFLFKNTSMQAIMRRIARWYDVSVRYQADVSGIMYSGGLSRKDSIEKLLELLELDGRVHFELKGRELSVMPNSK